MNALRWTLLPVLGWLLPALCDAAAAENAPLLENGRLALSFDPTSHALAAIHNKLTGEVYRVSGDAFALEATDFRLDFQDAKPTALERAKNELKAGYRAGGLTIEVAYLLGGENHFAEKRVALIADRAYGLKRITLSRVIVYFPSKPMQFSQIKINLAVTESPKATQGEKQSALT
jgi:hypothetical protein